jgi:lipopolysaccharide biosynthesis glycosyltransferase
LHSIGTRPPNSLHGGSRAELHFCDTVATGFAMDWFFAINENSAAFEIYADLAKVAVHSALTNTSLTPRLLYDGTENAFTRWMRSHNVDIISTESSLKSEMSRLDGSVPPAHLSTLPGVYLRIELPLLGLRLCAQDRVLYTDCDVMFRREIKNELSRLPCKYFAVAGEFDPEDYYNMNTGVMLMNLAGLREVDAEFRAFVKARFHEFSHEAWDQGAYRRFFGWERTSLLWDRLPPGMNWKPYWGNAADASIVHFHGPKPYEYERPNPVLHRLTGGDYQALSREWMRLLEQAG